MEVYVFYSLLSQIKGHNADLFLPGYIIEYFQINFNLYFPVITVWCYDHFCLVYVDFFSKQRSSRVTSVI